MSGILIGKVIYSVLSGNTNVKTLVNNKIYPIFAPDETLVPFIVYTRNNINTSYTKDGLLYDESSISVHCISDNYTECINIAQAVRSALEMLVGIYSGINIYSSIVTNVSEDFGIDGFITTIDFAIKSK